MRYGPLFNYIGKFTSNFFADPPLRCDRHGGNANMFPLVGNALSNMRGIEALIFYVLCIMHIPFYIDL